MINFKQPYNRTDFLNFLWDDLLPEDFVKCEDDISFEAEYTRKVTFLGNSESLELAVFEVLHNSKQDARVSLSKEAFRLLLRNSTKNKALILFVPLDNPNTYRFSLVTIDVEIDENKVRKSYSNPRRYSFKLGTDAMVETPKRYLAGEKGRIKDEKDLKGRFSVEALTKEFYRELSDWYFWAIDHVHFPSEPEDGDPDKLAEHKSKNVIRLLTRLLFVWFLKQKRLIPDEFFNEEYIEKNLLKGFNPNQKQGLGFYKTLDSIYYKAILQNLFFAMLNCPITPQSKEDTRERGFRKKDNWGQHRDANFLMRYEELFKDPKLFLSLANSTIPFLNGGLFDCLDDKSAQPPVYIDGFSDNLVKPHKLIVPDFLFFGEKEGKGVDLSGQYGDKKKKSVNIKGLINILSTYNFTIVENTPIDQEVSLDPELLGKVFENLLASYNPETKSTARKQTGSFYTPREIVQYMVDESLIAYLKNEVGEDLEPEYRKLMKYTDDEICLSQSQKEEIIKALFRCKIIDPACGSGAFPVGILQQMVHILRNIDQDNRNWESLILDEATKDSQDALQDKNDNKEDLLAEIGKAFDQSINRPDYARKLYLIENCIYGVDIQAIAVQISKLRFFISLVVEQKANSNADDNFGIRPLPNLEAKFVAANTLIGIEKKETTLFYTQEIKAKENELKLIRHKIFSAKNPARKRNLKESDKIVRNELAELLSKDDSNARILANWDPYDQNASSSFFDPEWMFGFKDGFDIVIGNPPWGAIFTKDEKKLLKEKYPEIDSSTPNSFAYFIGFAFKNYNSFISFVLPDSILIKDYSKTRELIKKNIFSIDWYQNIGIPEELRPFIYVEHDVCVINIGCQKLASFLCTKHEYNSRKKQVILNKIELEKKYTIIHDFDNVINLTINDKDIEIMKKILLQNPIKEFLQCHEGIHTGNARDILFKNYNNSTSFKPLYYGGGAGDRINNYVSYRNGWFVDYRSKIVDKSKGYYASLRDEKIFSLPKIYITRTGSPFKAFFDENNYASNNFFSLQFKKYSENSIDNLKLILPFIISPVSQYFIRRFAAPRLGSIFVETKIQHLLKFCIPEIKDKKKLLTLVCSIILAKQSVEKFDTSSIEREINKLIYDYYNLNEEEIAIIENC